MRLGGITRSLALLLLLIFCVHVSCITMNEAQCRSIVYETTPKITVVLGELPGDYGPIIPAKLAGTVKTRIAFIPLVPSTPIHPAALSAIKDFEHFSPKTYYCPGGQLTIGYGLTRDDLPWLRPGDTMTELEASEMLSKVLEEKYLSAVNQMVTVDLTPLQTGALVSFAFNVGVPAFKDSTLLAFLNAGKFQAAADEFYEWTSVKHHRLKGLVKRREVERKLFLSEER